MNTHLLIKKIYRSKHRNQFYLTIRTDDGVATFASDNWDMLPFFEEMRLGNNVASMILRVFTPLKITHNQIEIPIKEVCGFNLMGKNVVFLNREQIEKASNTNAITGEPMKKEVGVRFMDAMEMTKKYKLLIK